MGIRLNPGMALFRLNDYVTQPDGDDCYMMFLSGTSKSIVLSCLRYAQFTSSRWFIDDPAEFYEADRFTDAQIDQIDGLVFNAFAEVLMSCSTQDFFDNVARIATAVESLAECCSSRGGSSGQDIDSPPSGGVGSIGEPGDQFEDQEAYRNAKCNAANAIYDTVLGVVTDLDASDIDAIASGVAGGATAVMASKIANAGILGWAISKVSMAIISLVFMLIDVLVDFGDIASALDEQHDDELIMALYNAGDTATAKSSFMSALSDAATSLTAADTALVSTLLTSELLNQLFEPRADIVEYTSPDPVDCGALQIWTFPSSGEGWTFEDVSFDGGVSSGAWSSGDEGWSIDNDPNGGSAAGKIYLDSLAIAVDIGNSVQFDFGATSDEKFSTIRLKVIWLDLTEDDVYIGSIETAGTIVLDIDGAGTIETIECQVGRSHTSSNDPYTQVIQEVRVQ